MGFWGMSSRGKNARNQVNNIAGWQQGQATDWGDKANESWKRGQEGQDWAAKYWQNRAENPAVTPGQARRTGQDILNIDEPLANMWGRAAQVQSAWENNVPKAQQVTDQLNATTTTKGERLGDYGTGQQFLIDQGAGDLTGNVQRASGAVTDNLAKTYGDAAAGFNGAYDDLTGNINTTRDSLLGKTDAAYAGMDKNVSDYAKSVEMLKPGGEFAAAQTARSFAPAMASAEGRMRRGGIDPNSVQAASVMAGLSGQQATAMDDQMAQGTARYVDAQGNLTGMKNNLASGKLNTGIGLTQDALGMTTSLGQEQAGVNRDMTLAQGAETRGQIRSDAAALNNIITRGQDQTLNLNSDVHQQGQTNLDEQSRNAMANRDMAGQDFTTFSNLMKDQNNLDLTGIDLSKAQYDLGRQNELLNIQEQDKGAGALADIAQANFGNAGGAAGTAGQFARGAAGLYKNIWDEEAKNAGWGTKMLIGSGLSAATAGLGGLASGAGFWKGLGGM